ncbi:hypothetical protein HOK021_74950 [Streptomyces hygroscopicus]|nr:hypothetical protein HOK021_74950 [Streptomyces hygroscopicus]
MAAAEAGENEVLYGRRGGAGGIAADQDRVRRPPSVVCQEQCGGGLRAPGSGGRLGARTPYLPSLAGPGAAVRSCRECFGG